MTEEPLGDPPAEVDVLARTDEMAALHLSRAEGDPHGSTQRASLASMPAAGWQWFYEYKKDPAGGGDRYAAGVRAYKQALVDAGFGALVVVDLPLWGNYVRDRTAEFQASVKIGADGVVGPVTGKALLRPYVVTAETKFRIPDNLAGKQGTLESNNHAVAQGWADPGDEGWGQIHMPFHPEFTLAQAWDPKFAINWLAGQLWSNRMNLGDWDAALAAYNVGYATAKAWLAAGKPSSGGPIWQTPSGPVDAFTRASEYVRLVRSVAY